MSMQNDQACVWATRKELWDSFLNDPALARAIDNVRSQSETSDAKATATASDSSDIQVSDTPGDEQSIGARLRAYETPITDDILRQSIK
ncbi:hypothetical protein OAM69_02215 [bacterium]|nr:hypothetical protein [bacterium]